MNNGVEVFRAVSSVEGEPFQVSGFSQDDEVEDIRV